MNTDRDVKVAYLCNGKEECLYRPMCVYREDPVSKTDDVCKHTFDPRHAKYGACADPENHPERFVKIDIGEKFGEGDYCYWEEES